MGMRILSSADYQVNHRATLPGKKERNAAPGENEGARSEENGVCATLPSLIIIVILWLKPDRLSQN